MNVDLPDGTAVLRDKLVTERQYRIIESAFLTGQSVMAKLAENGLTDDMTDEEKAAIAAATPMNLDEANTMLDLQDAAIVAFLESWTLVQDGKPRPLPKLADVQDVEREIYKPLAAAALPKALSAMAEAGETSTEPTGEDFTPQGEAVTPTADSASSNGLSSAEAESTSTPSSPEPGESSPIEDSIPA